MICKCGHKIIISKAGRVVNDTLDTLDFTKLSYGYAHKELDFTATCLNCGAVYDLVVKLDMTRRENEKSNVS